MLLRDFRDSLLGRFATFSLVGVANTLIGVGVIVAARLLGAGPTTANVIGYGAGIFVSYSLNSRVTFTGRRSDRWSRVRFLGAFLAAFLVNLSIVGIIVRVTGSDNLLATLSGTPVYMTIFYLLCERWVFTACRDDCAKGGR